MSHEQDRHFHHRAANGDDPAGITVSKGKDLPEGDFMITEYTFPKVTLHFVDEHNFSEAERAEVYFHFLSLMGLV